MTDQFTIKTISVSDHFNSIVKEVYDNRDDPSKIKIKYPNTLTMFLKRIIDKLPAEKFTEKEWIQINQSYIDRLGISADFHPVIRDCYLNIRDSVYYSTDHIGLMDIKHSENSEILSIANEMFKIYRKLSSPDAKSFYDFEWIWYNKKYVELFEKYEKTQERLESISLII